MQAAVFFSVFFFTDSRQCVYVIEQNLFTFSEETVIRHLRGQQSASSRHQYTSHQMLSKILDLAEARSKLQIQRGGGRRGHQMHYVFM